MTIVEIERAVRDHFAAALGLTVDATLFRAPMPGERCNIVAIRVESVKTPPGDAMLQLEMQIRGRYADRDDALIMAGRIRAALPWYGDGELAALLPSMDAQLYDDTWQGKYVCGVSARVRVHVRC